MDKTRGVGSTKKKPKSAVKVAADKATGGARSLADGKAQSVIGGQMDTLWDALKK